MFKKMLGALGVGGPTVDTVLADPTGRPGAALTGEVRLVGGTHDVDVTAVALSLVTRVEVEAGDGEYDAAVEFHRLPVAGALRLAEGQRHAVPFTLPLPWETPVTQVYGQHLRGMTLGVRTEVAVARAVDKGDLDPVAVEPLPGQQAVLDAVARLGFRFKGADLERGHVRGTRQTLPFYQEIEFYAAPQYAHACTQLEVTFVADADGTDVVLEADKRGGLFSGGRDVFHHFRVPHAAADATDWAREVDGWLQRAVTGADRARHGRGDDGHRHGHHGVGGAAVAGGLVAGLVAAEVVDELGDAVEEFGGDAE